jgi:acetyltransferase-like isoleucine patch superfamily enzyme
LNAIAKNIRQRARLAWGRWMLICRNDVILEPGTMVKFWRSVSFGKRCTVQANAYIYGSRRGNAVTFGDYVVISHACMLLGEAGLRIGDFTHLGPRVVVTTQNADSRTDPCVPDPTLSYSPVTIGAGCWIGAGSIIMPGVHLGDRTIVAPNSVVFGRWPYGARLSGNPARPLKETFAGICRDLPSSPM